MMKRSPPLCRRKGSASLEALEGSVYRLEESFKVVSEVERREGALKSRSFNGKSKRR